LLAIGVILNDNSESLGKIAFVRDGNIWVQELPNGTPRQLTNGGSASGPQWSPSGEWLLYRERDEDADEPPGLQLRLIRGDSSQERLLSDNGSGYWLSEEDERILYYSSDDGAISEDADGGNQRTMFAPFEDDGERVRRFPLPWPSPDGEHQLYFETREPVDPPIRGASSPPTLIYVSNIDGTDPVLLTTIEPTADTQLFPMGWSSDGSHLLLIQSGDPVDGVPPTTSLVAVPIKGGEEAKLDLNVGITAQGDENAVGWLVVSGGAQESWTDKRIALVAPDAAGFELLTPPDVAAVSPRWSPEGKQIVYVAAPDIGPDGREAALSTRRLWLMAPDGSNQRQITSGDGFRDEAPMWSSDGESILFARLNAADPCYGDSYDLMRYRLDDGSLKVVASDLPLLGTYYDLDIGEIPKCEHSVDGVTTDFLGNLQLSSALNWWQPTR
jgi:hypothetical protein